MYAFSRGPSASGLPYYIIVENDEQVSVLVYTSRDHGETAMIMVFREKSERLYIIMRPCVKHDRLEDLTKFGYTYHISCVFIKCFFGCLIKNNGENKFLCTCYAFQN